MRHQLKFAALVVVLLFGIVAGVAAITWGEPDGSAHPYVGTLLFYQGDGYYSCTGTLLSPTVMLTAGHCVEGAGVENSATWVSFEPNITFEDRADGQPLADYLNKSSKWHKTADVIPHPLYADYNQFPQTYDIGLVILAKPHRLSQYGQLPPLGFLDSVANGTNRKDNVFTAVGYGSQGVLPWMTEDLWARFRAETALVELNSTFNGDDQSAKFSNNPGNGKATGGTCYGDSGGPVFHANSNVIGAIVSFGYTPCIGVDYQFRVDTPVAQNFVNQYLR